MTKAPMSVSQMIALAAAPRATLAVIVWMTW
jgi:hypothetical protein